MSGEKCVEVVAMACLNVAEWTPEQVADWLSGEKVAEGELALAIAMSQCCV